MSTGSGYDMILLSIKEPGGAHVGPARSRAPRRPRHHASPPKKRRGHHHCHLSASSRPTVRARQEVTQESTAPHAGTVGLTAQHHEDHTTTGGDALPGYFHTGCSPQEEHCRSAWTMPRRRSPGQYVQTPRRTWRDQWSSHAPLEHSGRRPSYQTSRRYEASTARALDGTRLPPSGSGYWRKDADTSTPPSQTPARNPTATTLLGNAITSMGQ